MLQCLLAHMYVCMQLLTKIIAYGTFCGILQCVICKLLLCSFLSFFSFFFSFFFFFFLSFFSFQIFSHT